MKREILCPDCGKKLHKMHTENTYAGEHVKQLAGHARKDALCDFCNTAIPRGARCVAQSTWTENSPAPYYPWENEFIITGNIIRGIAETRAVTIDGKPLSLEKSLALRNHSPTGFSWGYGGSGPAQLALAILLETTDQETALQLYQEFKWKYLASGRSENDLYLIVDIQRWLENRKKELTAAANCDIL